MGNTVEKNLSAVFLGKHSIETQEREVSTPKSGEVVIKNMAAGVCGTDIHIYHGEEGSAAVKPPVVLGHEYAGEVVAVGDKVRHLKPGDRVAVDPNIYCGSCHFCRIGKKQHCENLVAIGVNFDGGFAQYSSVLADQAYLLSPDVSFEAGAMAEPLACCIHGIDLAKIRQGDTVCVIGGGPIGLLMVQLAKLSGASMVILSEPIAMRREIGLQLGADYTIDPINEDVCGCIRGFTGVDGVDVVIECVGRTVATKQAFDIAKRGATVLLFSVPNLNATFELPLFDVFKKELKIIGSFINPDTHKRAVDLINANKINTNLIITHRFPVTQLEDAIKAQMDSSSIKVIVTPHS